MQGDGLQRRMRDIDRANPIKQVPLGSPSWELPIRSWLLQNKDTSRQWLAHMPFTGPVTFTRDAQAPSVIPSETTFIGAFAPSSGGINKFLCTVGIEWLKAQNEAAYAGAVADILLGIAICP